MRALVYVNDFLYLYEIEPEDKKLKSLYGVKFITQQRVDFLDIRCHHPEKGHLDYECAIMAGLQQHLTSNRVIG
ncbi:MAG TPA: hypothetical protein VGQ51_19060 [Puia sp.]|jgi:hypothetical protein|nr:hypothetical protein [Puia sp.]